VLTARSDVLASKRIEDVSEKVVLQPGWRLFRCEPAPELPRLNERNHKPGEADWRNISADGALGLTAAEDASYCFGYTRGTALQCGTDRRLELEAVRVFKEHAEHRRSMQVVEMLRHKKVAQPFVHLVVFASQIMKVRSGLLSNTVDRSRKQLGFGTEILEDDWLGYTHVRRNIGHARLLVTSNGKEGNRRVQDGGAAGSGGQSATSRLLNAGAFGMARMRAHDRECQRAQASVIC
jgi:hypothetical protein